MYYSIYYIKLDQLFQKVNITKVYLSGYQDTCVGYDIGTHGGSQNLSASQFRSFTAIDGSVIQPSQFVRNIGVIFDNKLNMERHVAAICKSAFFQIRNIPRIRKFLSVSCTKVLVHAFVTCTLDNCNSLLYGLPRYLVHRLQ